MIGWKEQEPEAELSVKHLKLSIALYLLQLFWQGLTPALLISHTLIDHLIQFVIKTYRRKACLFDVVPS